MRFGQRTRSLLIAGSIFAPFFFSHSVSVKAETGNQKEQGNFKISDQFALRLKEFFVSYRSGNYQNAIVELSKLNYDKKFEPVRHFFMAMSYKGFQKHEEAVIHFKKAIQLGYTSRELFYEYGQSLFAINSLDDARRAFRISYETEYERDVSLYYMGHISELLEEHELIKKYFLMLAKDPRTEKGMRQVAYLRLAELVYSNSLKKYNTQYYIAKYVVPLLDKAKDVDPDSETGQEVEARYDEILLKHNMHPLLLENGRMLSRLSTLLIFTQSIMNDDNVTLISDSPGLSNTSTDTGSLIYNSDFFYSKRFVGGNHFVGTPELRINYAEYANKANEDITQNNSYTIAPAIRGSYNFSWNGKITELLYEYDFNYIGRDKNKEGARTFFSRSSTYTLGLRRQFLKNGDTTFKYRIRNSDSFNPLLSGTTTTYYFDQLWLRENGHIFVGLFIADFYRPKETFFATDSYLFRADYLMPRLYKGIDLNLNASITMLDTKEQADDRGIERALSFGVKLQRRFSRHWRLALTLDRTQNDSKDPDNFSYTKMVSGLEIRYTY